MSPMPVPKVWAKIFMTIFRFSGFLHDNTQILFVCLSVEKSENSEKKTFAEDGYGTTVYDPTITPAPTIIL